MTSADAIAIYSTNSHTIVGLYIDADVAPVPANPETAGVSLTTSFIANGRPVMGHIIVWYASSFAVVSNICAPVDLINTTD